MTVEAVYAKICYLLNKYKDKKIIIKKFKKDMVGELTPDNSVIHDEFSNIIPAIWSS